MGRIALSLLLFGAMAPAAQAEGIRSLGVTVSPVGAWAATGVRSGVVMVGYGGALDWDFRKEGSLVSMGGHIAQTALFTEATPLRIRVGPQVGPLRPWLGVGASLLMPWQAEDAGDLPLRLGAEIGAGAELAVSDALFLSGEGRLQSFSLRSDLFSGRRGHVASAYLGVGFRL